MAPKTSQHYILARTGEHKRLEDGGFICYATTGQGAAIQPINKTRAIKAAKTHVRNYNITAYVIAPNGVPIHLFIPTFMVPGWIQIAPDYAGPVPADQLVSGKKVVARRSCAMVKRRKWRRERHNAGMTCAAQIDHMWWSARIASGI